MPARRTASRSDSLHNKFNNDQTFTKRLRLPSKPSSISEVFVMVALNLCKQIVFFSPQLRILVYCVCLFAISGIADVLTMPKFFSSDFLNQYFVKLGWFWTLFVSIPFVFMTSYTYCAGKSHLLWKHFARLAIATFFWYFWVNFFLYFENMTGHCVDRKELKSKIACMKAGSRWRGFDLSGHAFILIYSNLVLIEEARPILGWEGIADIIEKEDHSRANDLNTHTPLRGFSGSQFDDLRLFYEKFLPYVRLNFALIACLIITWDYMLLSTIMYFHSMPEKLLSGLIAIFIWFITYEGVYKWFDLLPGKGAFVYVQPKPENIVFNRRQSLS